MEVATPSHVPDEEPDSPKSGRNGSHGVLRLFFLGGGAIWFFAFFFFLGGFLLFSCFVFPLPQKMQKEEKEKTQLNTKSNEETKL